MLLPKDLGKERCLTRYSLHMAWPRFSLIWAPFDRHDGLCATKPWGVVSHIDSSSSVNVAFPVTEDN